MSASDHLEDLSDYETELDDLLPPASIPTSPAAIVIHALPTRHRVGNHLHWLQEDNTGLHAVRARWLLNEDRRGGKTHSSLVLVLHPDLHPDLTKSKLRLGKKPHRLRGMGPNIT